MLAIATISAVCEYETALLTLFIDLLMRSYQFRHSQAAQNISQPDVYLFSLALVKEKNRRKYYDVSVKSLKTSVVQIEKWF